MGRAFFPQTMPGPRGAVQTFGTVIARPRKHLLSRDPFLTLNPLVSGHRHPVGGSPLKAVGAFDETRGHRDHGVLSFRIWKNEFSRFQVRESQQVVASRRAWPLRCPCFPRARGAVLAATSFCPLAGVRGAGVAPSCLTCLSLSVLAA